MQSPGIKVVLFSILLVVFVAGGVVVVVNHVEKEAEKRDPSLKEQLSLARAKCDELLKQVASITQTQEQTQADLDKAKSELSSATTELASIKADLADSKAKFLKEHNSLLIAQNSLALMNEIAPHKDGAGSAFGSESSSGAGSAQPSAPVKPPPPPIDFQALTASLAIIEGDKTSGNGFVVNLQGTPMLITAAPVLSGNSKVDVHFADGKTVTPDTLSLGVDNNLATLPIPALGKGVDMLDNIPQKVVSGDEIVVVGTGAPIKGHITDINPDSFGLDAPITSGNSGNPVIQVASGKVIGMAVCFTAADARSLGHDNYKFGDKMVRAACRLDTDLKWQKVTWPVYAQEAQGVQDIRARSKALSKLFQDIYDTGAVTFKAYGGANNPLKDLVSDLRNALKQAHMGGSFYTDSKTSFLSYVEDLCEKDTAALPPPMTHYHRELMNGELVVRQAMQKELKHLTDIQDNSLVFGPPHASN